MCMPSLTSLYALEDSSQRKGTRAGSGLRKPATAPGKQDGSRLTALRATGDEAPSETSHSVRCKSLLLVLALLTCLHIIILLTVYNQGCSGG